MSDFVLACPTVPVVQGSEVRFSLRTAQSYRLPHWPLAYESCGELIPVQSRLQWGVNTEDARYDSYGGVRLGSLRNNITFGARTTYAGSRSRIASVERQRVGVVSLTLGGLVNFRYWNDHGFWWWPMGGGTDQGDTAGVMFGYNLGAHNLSAGRWRFESLNLSLRLATGIPDPGSVTPFGQGRIYSRVTFDEISRGDIDLNASLSSRSGQNLVVGLTVNSDRVRDATQNDLVHDNLDIPRVPAGDRVEMMMYLKWTGW